MTVADLIDELIKYPPDTLVGVVSPSYDWDFEQASTVMLDTVDRYNRGTMGLPEETPYVRIV